MHPQEKEEKMLVELGWVSNLMLQKQVGDQFYLVENDPSHEYHKYHSKVVTIQVEHD